MFRRVLHGEVGLEVLTDLHRPLREYEHRGETFVEAVSDKEYLVRLCNRTPGKVLAVLTVDGLSVMDGEDGDKNGSGYVLHPRQEIFVPGWRLDDSSVARFRFSEPADSYAAQKGKASNVGVIGCCFWSEKQHPNFSPASWSNDPHWKYTTRGFNLSDAAKGPRFDEPEVCQRFSPAAPSPESRSVNSDSVVTSKQAVGTGFGRRQDHRVATVRFDREAELGSLTVRYNTREKLADIGIVFDGPDSPNPFPASKEGCAPPPGWSG